MTCIIATSRFVCADRRVDADGVASSMVKVAREEFRVNKLGLAAQALAQVGASLMYGPDVALVLMFVWIFGVAPLLHRWANR